MREGPTGPMPKPKVASDLERATSSSPRIGSRTGKGAVLAGLSGDGKPMYTTPANAPLRMSWDEAMKYAAGFIGHGQRPGTCRLPTTFELNVLFQNRASIGGFNEAGEDEFVWTSGENPGGDGACVQWFMVNHAENGRQGWPIKGMENSVRLVWN
jgi:hypothetical protein